MTHPRSPRWILLWACLLASLYLPTLATPFDFNDDGNLVYPAASMPPGRHLRHYWDSVIGDYHNLGVFRPVLLAHWKIEANLLGPSAFRWRLTRLLWAALAAAAMLTLMIELQIRPAAAVVATMVAMWAPEQSEVWNALTLSEGVAMPYALIGLICAVRAARSTRPLRWDIAGAACVLAALGCKNTFAAIVPAQLLLRMAPDGQHLRQAWRRHGWHACLLALTLALPAVHFALYERGWHPGQYAIGAPLPNQFIAMLRGMGKEAAFLVFPLALSAVALLASGFATIRQSQPHGRWDLTAATAEGLGPLWREYRGPCLAGSLLLIAGIGIYLPVRLHNPGGRYSIPAAWGGDLWVAALLSAMLDAPVTIWKRAAEAAIALGIAGIAVANLAQQDRFAARARCLWRTLNVVQREAAPNACIGWLYGPALARGEGIHFAWHSRACCGPLRMALIDAGSRQDDAEDTAQRDLGGGICHRPSLLVSGDRSVPPGYRLTLMREIEAPYWLGRRRYDCYLWQAPRTDSGTTISNPGRRKNAGTEAGATESAMRGLAYSSSSGVAGGAISLAATLIGTSREPPSPSRSSSR